jgi:Tol biopolymer transport system component
MTRGHLPALLGTLAAAVVVACAVALASLAVSGEAEATFPGKNGRIAYNSNGVIYTINPDGSGKSKVTNTHVSGDPIDYSPDGKKITYMSYEGFNDGSPSGPQKDAEIYTINLDGSGKTNVTNNNRYDVASSYSPDGKRIAYTHWDGNDLEIYTINTDGTGVFRVTNNRTNEYDPSYSPDGKTLVFSGSSEKHSGIYTISARGGGKTKVAEGGDDPDYSPDGKKIVTT